MGHSRLTLSRARVRSWWLWPVGALVGQHDAVDEEAGERGHPGLWTGGSPGQGRPTSHPAHSPCCPRGRSPLEAHVLAFLARILQPPQNSSSVSGQEESGPWSLVGRTPAPSSGDWSPARARGWEDRFRNRTCFVSIRTEPRERAAGHSWTCPRLEASPRSLHPQAGLASHGQRAAWPFWVVSSWGPGVITTPIARPSDVGVWWGNFTSGVASSPSWTVSVSSETSFTSGGSGGRRAGSDSEGGWVFPPSPSSAPPHPQETGLHPPVIKQNLPEDQLCVSHELF